MNKSRVRKSIDPLDPENFYADAISAGSKRHGVIVIDGKACADTLQCAHHGGHFVPRKGRGDWMCLKCGGPVCGMQKCVTECANFEQRLDEYESGKRGSL